VIRVGLTGTVGAGKSTVGRMFERWGAWRVDADQLAREAVEPGTAALRAIRERFGEGVIGPDGRLDRAALRRRVFDRPGEREALERIVHPAVQRLRAEAVEAARRAGARVVVAEIPLLFETGLEDAFDVVVAVDAPEAARRARIESERGLEPGTFGAIEAAQWPAARKSSRADLVIENDGDLERLEREARAAWEAIVARAGGAGA
jgi:dephospho-CoA kinase